MCAWIWIGFWLDHFKNTLIPAKYLETLGKGLAGINILNSIYSDSNGTKLALFQGRTGQVLPVLSVRFKLRGTD